MLHLSFIVLLASVERVGLSLNATTTFKKTIHTELILVFYFRHIYSHRYLSSPGPEWGSCRRSRRSFSDPSTTSVLSSDGETVRLCVSGDLHSTKRSLINVTKYSTKLTFDDGNFPVYYKTKNLNLKLSSNSSTYECLRPSPPPSSPMRLSLFPFSSVCLIIFFLLCFPSLFCPLLSFLLLYNDCTVAIYYLVFK